ncbi:MAG: insulinase family protein, partial [Litorimonas sp.]
MTYSRQVNLQPHKLFTQTLLSVSAAALLLGCSATEKTDSLTPQKISDASSAQARSSSANLDIPFEKITLDNGLDVIFHVDRSDPVVAINLAAHVGSARETKGRTGFAHLFEHLLFLDSENLGYGGLDEMNTRIGGEGTNGFTTNDMTQYFQAVPKDGLEKIIWAEADKLGWFINTVSQNVIDKEKQVVKNEKRQRVDNQPYGHNFSIIGKALYPEDHPYNWQVIGSLVDLDAASLQDTKDFYAKWYVPNNVTITLSGDFDIAEAKTLIKKYFGEIPRGDAVKPYPARAGTLSATRKIMHEDDFAAVPQLTMVWPSVEQYHPDSYALDMLMTYLTDGKKAPFVDVLIDEQALTSRVAGFHNTAEIAGELYLIISPNSGEDIDGLLPAIEASFKRFEDNGVNAEDLDRIKASAEVNFYGQVQSALGKAIQLSEYNLFANDPAFYKTELAARAAVTPNDLMRVYNTYIKDEPYLATSFVPKGQSNLALEGSETASIENEKIVQGAEKDLSNFDPAARILEATTPSSFDRTIEPEFGATVTLTPPKIWRTNLENGMSVFGLKSNETPLIRFSLELTSAGKDRTSLDRLTVPDLLADLMLQGTESMSASELEDAIKELGADIRVGSTNSATVINVVTLARNFDATLKLVEDIVTKPAFD